MSKPVSHSSSIQEGLLSLVTTAHWLHVQRIKLKTKSFFFFITCINISCKFKLERIIPTFVSDIYLRQMYLLFVQGHLPHCNQFLTREHAEETEAADCHVSLLSEMATQSRNIRRAHSGQPHVSQPLLCLQKLQKEQVSKAILQSHGAHTTFTFIPLVDGLSKGT